MRYRAMDANGDYVFAGASPFLVNTPNTVAQAIRTRMALFTGEWFLDQREGLNKMNILGYGTSPTRDREVQRRILGTPGVQKIINYASSVNGRAFRVDAIVQTIYGTVTLSEIL